jgi:3-phenylpropionate/trans-cinnamate dioxygenase ferredoxin subunit
MSLRDTLDSLGGPVGSRADARADDDRARVANAAELTDGGSKLVYFQGEQVALFNAGGTLYAVANRCSHANGPLVDGALDGATVTCPLHDSRFGLATGEPLCGPANRPIKTYEVTVQDGCVYLSPNSAA